MKNTDFVTINIYNNDYADVVTEQGTIYTDRQGAYGFIAAARTTHKEVGYTRYANGDQTYWFN